MPNKYYPPPREYSEAVEKAHEYSGEYKEVSVSHGIPPFQTRKTDPIRGWEILPSRGEDDSMESWEVSGDKEENKIIVVLTTAAKEITIRTRAKDAAEIALTLLQQGRNGAVVWGIDLEDGENLTFNLSGRTAAGIATAILGKIRIEG